LIFDEYQNFSLTYIHDKSKNPQNKGTDYHKHETFEIFILLSGKASYFIEQSVYNLVPGDIVIVNSEEGHKQVIHPCNDHESIQFNFDPGITSFINHPASDPVSCFTDRPLGTQNKRNLQPVDLKVILDLFESMENLKNHFRTGLEVFKLLRFVEILMHIYLAFKDMPKPEKFSKAPQIIQNISTYIENNFERDLSLGSMEEKFHISRFYLSHEFKKYTSFGFREYIVIKRVQHAKLLLSKGLKPAEACSLSGFNDYSNFNKVFKKYTRVSPTEYIRNIDKGELDMLQHANIPILPKYAKLPDLVVTGLFWSPEIPEKGDSILLSVVVMNVGRAATPEGVTLGVGFNILDTEGREVLVVWSDNHSKALAPGETVLLRANSGIDGVNTWTAVEGSYRIVAYADDMNRIAESNEDNNVMEKFLNICGD